ncbi:MAG TPA: hypothetical protein VFB38_10020 [Chthonomonadaceae bacterium]|nr:hypothetical protein [Chthonomonadaceae bacterium]
MSVPEVRRLLCRLIWQPFVSFRHWLLWSQWRRTHQEVARYYHYKRRLTTVT